MLQHYANILLRTPLQSLNKAYQPDESITPVFAEGLYLSSPEYWNEFLKRDELKGKEREKLELSFHKYWLRSCSRCTPYGTFAGSVMAAIRKEATRFVLQPGAAHTRRLRLDMNYLSGIIQVLEQQEAIRRQLLFFTNNSLYELPDGFRYAEYTIVNNTRNYHLTSIEKTPYVKAVLEKARSGSNLKDLAALLMSLEDVSEEEAGEFLLHMVQSQLLISELEPCVTGDEPLDQLIDHLAGLQDIDAVLGKLREIQSLIRNPEEGVAFYQLIEQRLKELELSLEVPKNTLQTDLFLSSPETVIDEALVDEIGRQAEALSVLARNARNAELDDFKKNFSSRYEEKEIPLAIALDADLGIGYAGVRDESAGGGPLVDDIGYAGGGRSGGSDFDYIQQFAFSKYQDYLKHGKDQIEITEDELKRFSEQVKGFRFAGSIHVMGSLLKEEGMLSAEKFRFDLSGMGGPSAGNLLGRFTHGDASLCEFTRSLLRDEEERDTTAALYAEIAHLPQARIGNILLRPVLRRYEIPYIGRSGAPEADQIPVDDLMVSVRNNEVVLRSKKHNRRVIPRLTTAHNFGYRSLPVYKFLCDLQSQGLSYAGIWDWGNIGVVKHLPRVVFRNLIVYKATWRVEEKDLDKLPQAFEDQVVFVKEWRTGQKMPARVVYKEGDNELLLDLEQEAGIRLFLHYLKRYKNIQLEEFLFTEENCVVADVDGNPFTNEIIIPMRRVPDTGERQEKQAEGEAKKIPDEAPVAWAADTEGITRKFSIFSTWHYFKIYSGTKTAEKLLKEAVLPFIEQGIEDKLFEKFFFIRYRDEFSHSRIRFYNSDPDKQLELHKRFMQCLQPLLDNGTIDKVVLDSYVRELERYGGPLIEEAEDLFHHDSLAILRFINLLDGAEGEQYRFLFAMRGIDMLLKDFGLELEDRLLLARQIQTGFFREFGGHPQLQKALNDKYRKHQKTIFNHMDAEKDVANEIDEGVAIFEIRSESNEAVIRRLKEKTGEAKYRDTIFSLLPSYIHMFMNRLFIAQQRKYELVIYHFLERYYSSQLSIQKKGKTDALHRLQTT